MEELGLEKKAPRKARNMGRAIRQSTPNNSVPEIRSGSKALMARQILLLPEDYCP
jgi:hypothetical protein